MKATQLFKYVFLLAGIFMLNACQEDDIPEPNGVKITFKAVTGLKSSMDTLVIEEAFIGIHSIDLKREGEGDSATVEKIVYHGPYVVDLVNEIVSPAIRWIFAEPGYYTSIDIKTFNSLPRGNSIFLKGSLMPVDGSEKIPFQLVTSGIHTLEIENNTGITIREGEEVELLVVFNLTDLFSKIDLTDYEKNDQGVVVISETQEAGALSSVINTFETFSSFGINNGLPFPETDDGNPGNESPEQGDGSEDDNDDDNDEPGEGADEQPDEGSSDEEPEDSDSSDEGAADEDQEEGSSGDADDEEGENSDDQDSGTGNTDNPSDDDEEDSGNEDDNDADSGSGSGDADEDTGNEQDEQDSGNEDQDSGEEDDEDGDEDKDGKDDGDDDDDKKNDDDDEDDDDDKDDDDDDDDEKGKGKGNNGNSDRGKKN